MNMFKARKLYFIKPFSYFQYHPLEQTTRLARLAGGCDCFRFMYILHSLNLWFSKFGACFLEDGILRNIVRL